jgi:hypothetical protein
MSPPRGKLPYASCGRYEIPLAFSTSCRTSRTSDQNRRLGSEIKTYFHPVQRPIEFYVPLRSFDFVNSLLFMHFSCYYVPFLTRLLRANRESLQPTATAIYFYQSKSAQSTLFIHNVGYIIPYIYNNII